jgi:hypothetical protein
MKTNLMSVDTQANPSSSDSRRTSKIRGVNQMHYAKLSSVAAGIMLVAFATAASAAGFCPNQNFDSVTAPALPAGWTSTVTTGAASTSGWVTRAVGYADSGTNAAWVDDVNDYADISLTSATYAIAATGTASISFRQSYFLWSPDASPLVNRAFSGAVLEFSVDGGAFSDIVTAGGSISVGNYNASLDPNSNSPIAPTAPLNRKVWSGDSGGFITSTATLPAAASGHNVAFRWRLGTEGGGRSYDTHSGWWIDTVALANPSDDIFKDDFEGCN